MHFEFPLGSAADRIFSAKTTRCLGEILAPGSFARGENTWEFQLAEAFGDPSGWW